MESVLPIYNAHHYFSLKNLGKKSVHYTRQNFVSIITFCQSQMWKPRFMSSLHKLAMKPTEECLGWSGLPGYFYT